MKIIPRQPWEWFTWWPNIKIYSWYLADEMKDILNVNKDEESSVKYVSEWPDGTMVPQHLFIRHFESKYNEYKEKIKTTESRHNFLTETDRKHKEELYNILCHDFYNNVGIDARTWLSDRGIEQGKEAGRFWSEFFKKNPHFFPDRIVISPYLRTKLTAYYSLRDTGLDMDFSLLEKPFDTVHNPSSWVEIGSFHGKDVVIKFSEQIRERDHGKMGAPHMFTKVMNQFNREHNIPQTMEEYMSSLLSKGEYDEEHYYKTLLGWESQTQVNARAAQYLHNLKHSNDKMTMNFTHHLVKIGLLLKTMWWGYPNFRNFDDHYRPTNGSLSVITKIPKTQSWQEDKMRFSLYNAELQSGEE